MSKLKSTHKKITKTLIILFLIVLISPTASASYFRIEFDITQENEVTLDNVDIVENRLGTSYEPEGPYKYSLMHQGSTIWEQNRYIIFYVQTHPPTEIEERKERVFIPVNETTIMAERFEIKKNGEELLDIDITEKICIGKEECIDYCEYHEVGEACEDIVTEYTLTIDPTSGGEVISPSIGTHSFEEGETVSIEAEPDSGYIFDQWIGDTENIMDVGSPETSVTMENDYSISAQFEEEEENGIIDPVDEEPTEETSVIVYIILVVIIIIIAVLVLLLFKQSKVRR